MTKIAERTRRWMKCCLKTMITTMIGLTVFHYKRKGGNGNNNSCLMEGREVMAGGEE